MGRDSFNNWNKGQQTQRYRDRRGVYQSMEAQMLGGRGRYAGLDPDIELDRAAQRLRTIEKVTQIRQDKIRREFTDLETDLKIKEDN